LVLFYFNRIIDKKRLKNNKSKIFFPKNKLEESVALGVAAFEKIIRNRNGN
jgi:hypothetical protein